MRVFYSFQIIVTAVFLFLLPLTDMAYEYRTEEQTDDFSVTTGVGVTSANCTLDDFIYDDDDDTIEIESSLAEVPTATSYNGTTKTVLVSTLTANATRTLSITYDIDAIPDNDAINTMIDRWPWIWMLVCIAFPVAGIAAIFTGRA